MAHYTAETLRSYTDKARARLNYYLGLPDSEFENIHVKLSQGDVKIGRTINNALLPVISCGHCAHCAGHCYDIKACNRFPAALENRAINTALAMRAPGRYFNEIIQALKNRTAMRWHQGGEIINVGYLAGMVHTAELTEHCRHWGYTHEHGTVNEYLAAGNSLPENLSIMFSAENDDPIDNPFGVPEFRCISKGHTPPAGFMECPGNCQYCLAHRTGCPYGVNTYAWEH